MKLIQMERITTQTLLGIKFWDGVLARSVADGLYVKAQRISDDRQQRLGRVVVGYITPSGVIAFKGLSAHENLKAEVKPDSKPDVKTMLWEKIPPEQLVVVDVTDTLRRYLSMSFVVQIPQRRAWRGRGAWQTTPLMRPIPDSPDGDEGVMLWSSAIRTAPNGFAIIRAQIVHQDGETERKAAYALVEVNQPTDLAPPDTTFNHFGIADENGILTLIVPYPPVPPPPIETDRRGRPIRGAEPKYSPLDTQTFTLDFNIRYDLALQSKLPGSDVPNLEQILTQTPSQIGTHWDAPERNTLTTVDTLRSLLQFDKPLILRTRIGAVDAEETESVLRIQ